jgi:hypothetical protein
MPEVASALLSYYAYVRLGVVCSSKGSSPARSAEGSCSVLVRARLLALSMALPLKVPMLVGVVIGLTKVSGLAV